MAELADAHGSGPCPRKWVEVRILSAVLTLTETHDQLFWYLSSGSPTMRIVRFIDPAGNEQYGCEQSDGSVTRLEGSLYSEPLFSDLRDTGELVEVAERLAPIAPCDIYCIGLNYARHAEEGGKPIPENPVVFMKSSAAVQHPGKPIVLPRKLRSDRVDYECELVVVIGRTCKNVSREEALDYVLGYTCGNDVSARDWQKQGGGGQWVRGKTFDTFAPLGPVLVTADELPHPNDLRLSTTLNGKVMQDWTTSDMIFDVGTLIEFLSGSTTLLPGTAIFTGTPHGVGFARTPPVYLQPGDQLTVEIEQIGQLTNQVVEEVV